MQFNWPVDMGTLAVAILIPLGGGIAGSLATAGEIKGWYTTIRKPWWNPPNWLFGPVWTVLYIAMGVASWMVYKSGDWRTDSGVNRALILYIVQLVLNFLWTPIFFKLHWLAVACAEMSVMLLFIALTVWAFTIQIGAFWPLVLMGPYIAWVFFATCLTFWIWKHNIPGQTDQHAGRGKLREDHAMDSEPGSPKRA